MDEEVYEHSDHAPDVLDAAHELELGLEWLLRAQAALMQCHHATGHAMDHLNVAETHLREVGADDLADRLRDGVLPRGVTAHDEWTYELVEAFEEGPLAEVETIRDEAVDDLTGGERHAAERAQRRAWERRSGGPE